MSTTRTETGTIDLKGQKAANDNASKTASNYITAVSNDGIWVTPSDGKPANGTAIARTTGWHISDALEYFRKGFSHFRLWMDTTLDKMKMRLGQDTSGHVVIDDDGVEVFSDGYTSSAYFGSETRVGREVGSHIELSQDGLDYKFGSSSLFAIEAVPDASYTIIGTALWSQVFNLSAMSAQAISSEEVTTNDEITVSLSGCTSSRPDARLLYLVNGEYVPVPLYMTGESVPSDTTVYARDFGTIDLCEYSDELIEYVKTGEYGYVFRLYLASGSQALSTTVALAFAEPSVDSVEARIGKSTESHVELDYHSLQLVDAEGDTYFHVVDLRDENGRISDTWEADGTTRKFTLTVPSGQSNYAVYVDDVEITSGVTRYMTGYFIFDTAPSAGSIVKTKYIPFTYAETKSFTFGYRDSSARRLGCLSFATGNSVAASGDYAFAEGSHTSARGTSSHAEGGSTVASGLNSHAQNSGTRALSSHQTALGKYNVEDTSGTYAVIVGNGTSDSARSNALAIRWDGIVDDANAIPGSVVPIGTVIDYAGITVPAGYLECDGSAVSRTTYALLFAAIGTSWGTGDGSTTFNLPDFRGRVSIGAGTGTAGGATAHAFASTGGDERMKDHSHTLSRTTNVGISDHAATACTRSTNAAVSEKTLTGQVAAYSDTGMVGSGTTVSGVFSVGTKQSSVNRLDWTSGTSYRLKIDASHDHGMTQPAFKTPTLSHTITQPVFSAGNTGGGSADNMQPFATLRKIIRAA